MLFIPSARDDIVRYYQHTYVKFRELGDTLYYIHRIFEDRVEAVDVKHNQVVIYLDDDHPYEVDYVLPHKSYFQDGDRAMMLFRIPAQQYKRGICGDNVCMGFPMGSGNGGDYETVELSFQRLQTYVNKPLFVSLPEAIGLPYHSTVLSPRMAYVREPSTICVDFVPVARVEQGSRIKMLRPIFRKEVEEIAGPLWSIE